MGWKRNSISDRRLADDGYPVWSLAERRRQRRPCCGSGAIGGRSVTTDLFARPVAHTSRRISIGTLTTAVIVGSLASACATKPSTSPTVATRSYRMGFSDLPPVLTDSAVIATITLWMQRADAGILHLNPPWTQLLAGASSDSLVRVQELGLVQLYRAHGLTVVIEVDVTNGLDRSAEAPALDSAGRSITDPAVQQLYRNYVASIVRLLAPDYLGLASEVNLIQAAAPAPLYAAVVQMTNAAASDVHASTTTLPLYVSVQVETAWGRLTASPYIGIARQFTDFPFITVLGLSTYPYLGGFTDPSQLPLDYYTRLDSLHPIPMMVVEGGWASVSAGTFTSTPQTQARYIARQMQLLDSAHAIGVFQLEFADIELAQYQQPPGSILPLFATIGLVDTTLAPKPALNTWDSAFARPRRN